MANNISNIDPAKVKSVAGQVDSKNSDLQTNIRTLTQTITTLDEGFKSQSSGNLVAIGNEIKDKLGGLSTKVGDFVSALDRIAKNYGGHDDEALSTVKSFDGLSTGSSNINTISAQLTAEKY